MPPHTSGVDELTAFDTLSSSAVLSFVLRGDDAATKEFIDSNGRYCKKPHFRVTLLVLLYHSRFSVTQEFPMMLQSITFEGWVGVQTR
jgi:hypothetical protein